MTQVHFVLKTPADTEAVAKQIAQALPSTSVLALQGNLGTGKTTFSQHLARALGVGDTVTSPTFTLMNEYSTPGKTVIHADFYRLNSETEARALGIVDYFTQPHTITIIEWADMYPSLIPNDALWATFQLTKDQRIMTLKGDNTLFWFALEKAAFL